MGKINKLPKDLIEKIAAGEVVERPASVVKELVENSIDAGARAITVQVIAGGSEKIVVADDGVGMSGEDLGLCVERHATSKLKSEEGLWDISTMGFRGEALAAIGAVSKLFVESKVNDPKVVEGACIRVEGSDVLPLSPAGCAGGTKVEVSELFFNVPARKKFLKKPLVELGHVSEVISSLALANPGVRFELFADGKRKLFFPQVADGDDKGLIERVLSVVGEKHRCALKGVNEDGGGISVHGYFSDLGQRSGKDVHVFLNRRPVRDKLILHAVTSALVDGDGRGVYPAAALWVGGHPSKVDVNVHPAKREVRFAEPSAVHDFIRAAIKKNFSGLLSGSSSLREGSFSSNIVALAPSPLRGEGRGEGEKYLNNTYRSSPHTTSKEKEIAAEFFRAKPVAEQSNFGAAFETRLRPIGQYKNSYVVCEGDGGELVLIDQHAAHERIGFDEMISAYKSGGVRSQLLFIPQRVELGDKAFAYFAENLGALEKAGFEVDPFGGNTLMVRGVPELLSGVSVAGLFEKIAEEFEEIGSSRSVDDVVEKIISVAACHAQVRAGKSLGIEEMSALVRDVERLNVTRCPHGRPAVVKLGVEEIEKLFRRRG